MNASNAKKSAEQIFAERCLEQATRELQAAKRDLDRLYEYAVLADAAGTSAEHSLQHLLSMLRDIKHGRSS